MSDQTPLLSIIIPTKNRYIYLESCLRSLLPSYNNKDVEIIITDNSTSKEDITSTLSLFSNIKYVFIAKPISQVENFESALEMATGQYVTMIGDDDGLSGILLDVVKYMVKNFIDALNSPFATYYWPDVVSKSRVNDFSGKMFFDSYSYTISDVKAASEIQKCLNLGGTSLCNLPRMYYGIIKKEVLELVKKQAGVYFPGPSPDMANAFSAALFTNRFVYFDAPLFIAGNSAKSAAGMGLSGKHIGAIEGNPQLPEDCHLNWTPLIPKYWSGPTIWAESVMQVLKNCKKANLESLFNFSRLYASCETFNPEYKEEINTAINTYKKSRNTNGLFLRIGIEKLKVWSLRFKSLYKNMLKKAQTNSDSKFEGINTIEESVEILRKFEVKLKSMI